MAQLSRAVSERAKKLRAVIDDLRYRYHVLDDPTVTDEIYDSLTRELKTLEEQYPALVTPDSPTQRVGGAPLKKFAQVRHSAPMLSLNDVVTEEEFAAWEERLRRLVPDKAISDFTYFGELKIDGLAVSLIYENGLFVRGATRGNGIIGEDVTQNLKTIRSIPLRLREAALKEGVDTAALRHLEVRGEVYFPKKNFENLNRQRAKDGLPLFANPRNAAAGSVRQLDPKITASRNLSFVVYALPTPLAGVKTHADEHETARKLGFRVDPRSRVLGDRAAVQRFYVEQDKQKTAFPFNIDGIVIQVNDNALRQELGVVGKAPRGSIAYKFTPEQVTTKLLNIDVNVGRTGALTPVAFLEPVNVAGTTVSKATLHNEDQIARLDVRQGDTVVIHKAGEIIPEVVSVIKDLRTGAEKPFVFPKACPVCGGRVVREAGAAVHRCTNLHCPAKNLRWLGHFVSKGAFDIDGLGPQILAKLVDVGLVGDPADLFILKVGDLAGLERFGEKLAENIFNAVQARKHISLGRFLYALGIAHVGEVTAEDVAVRVLEQLSPDQKTLAGAIKKLEAMTEDDFTAIAGIGPIVARELAAYFHNPTNQKLLGRFVAAGITIDLPRRVRSGPFEGETVLFTGELAALPRSEAQEKVRALGGMVANSVTKETTLVVVGENPGAKLAKAEKLGIPIIDENEFLKRLKAA